MSESAFSQDPFLLLACRRPSWPHAKINAALVPNGGQVSWKDFDHRNIPPGERKTGNNEGWHRLDIPLGTERTKRLQQFVDHFQSRKLSVIQHTNQQIAGLEVSRKVIRKRADCL